MLLVGNGKLITRDPDIPFIPNGCVAIRGTAVSMVGTTSEIREKYPDSEFIDAKGGLIMPGFINSHMHFYSTFSRGMTPPGAPAKDFSEVLERLWWKLDKALCLKDIYYSTMTALVDCIKCGCTTVIDHHASPSFVQGSLFEIAKATKEAGIRASLCYEVSDRDGQKTAYNGIRENISFIDWAEAQNDPMISAKFGLHASFTLSDLTLGKCVEEMGGRKAGYHVHVAEGPDDEKDSVQKYGKRIAERFNDFGITGEKSIFVHCIHVNKKEREIIKETDTAVVHNPESNMGNAVGSADIREMVREGILVGLGTDGYLCDMLQSYRIGNALCKHSSGDPNAGWTELPHMLFENNITIAERCFPVKIGRIKEEYAADIIIMDYMPPTEMNEKNINGHLLFGASGRNVVTTIANGKVLMKDRKLTELDRIQIFAKARESSREVWKRL